MNNKIKTALRVGDLIDFGKLFATHDDRRKKQILTKARYLQAAIELRKLRQKMKLTQAELAKKMQVEREFVTRIESGRQNITLDTCYRIAEATNRDFIFGFK